MSEPSAMILTDKVYRAFAVCLVVLFTIGFVGQILSFLVLLHKEHRSKELNPYLLNVCAANSLALAVQFPLVFAACLSHGWTLGSAACYVTGFTGSVTAFVMIATLSYVCVKIFHHIIERDLVTNASQLNQLTANGNLVSWRSNWKTVLSTWVAGIALLLPTPLGWGSIAAQAGGTSCAPDWSARSVSDSSYLIVLVLLGFVVPLSVACLYLIKIYRYTTRHPAGLQSEGFSFQYLRARYQHVTAAKVISVEVLVYLLVWLPYWVCGVITLLSGDGRAAVDGGRGEADGRKWAAVVPWILAHVGAVYFPCVYAAMNSRFRSTLSSIVGCVKKKQRITPTINVDRFEGDRSEISTSTRSCSPNVMMPRSPLTNRAFQLPLFEDIASELVTPRPKTQRKFHFTIEAITKFMRTSLDTSNGPMDGHLHHRERRNTTEI